MLRVKFDGMTGFSEKQEAKLWLAGRLIEKVVNTDEFEKEILRFSFQYSVCTGSLWWKKCRHERSLGFHYTNKTNALVYDSIMSGAEILRPDQDCAINVDINLTAGKSNVLGYTYPNTLKTWISRWFLDSAPASEIAGNIMHEWCHKIGYDHEYRNTALRQYSVPYAVGYIVSNLAANA